jgi:hypothetical protein
VGGLTVRAHATAREPPSHNHFPDWALALAHGLAVVERAGRGKLTGSCVLASQTVSASCSSESPSAPLRSAPLRSAPLRSAPLRLALMRLVPLKSVRRSVGDSLTLPGRRYSSWVSDRRSKPAKNAARPAKTQTPGRNNGDRATPRYCVNWLGSARTISGFPCARHREALERRSFASTSSAICCMPGASFTRTNHLELEIGFGDPEYLAASLFAFSATFEICRDDRICRQGSCQNSGRRRDSLTMNTI